MTRRRSCSGSSRSAFSTTSSICCSGLIGLAAARAASSARAFLLGGGVVYVALWLYGMVIDKASDANFVPVNTADSWLHFGLGAGMILLPATAPAPARWRVGTAGP